MPSPLRPSTIPKWLLAIGALVILPAITHVAHRAVERQPTSDEAWVGLNAEAVRIVSAGHHTSAADLAWLQLVQHMGTSTAQALGWPLLQAYSDLVVHLDPRFGYAYEVAGILLSATGRVGASNDILDRGMRNVPDRWQLPFFAGFNRWHEQGDLRAAAVLMLRASELPGSPYYLGELASRLYSSSGSIEEGIRVIEASVAMTSDPLMRQQLEHRRDQLLAEAALQLLEDSIRTFRSQRGRIPATIGQLDDPQVRGILASPVGPTIEYDPATGAVRSTLLPKRLIVYQRPQVPEALAAP